MRALAASAILLVHMHVRVLMLLVVALAPLLGCGGETDAPRPDAAPVPDAGKPVEGCAPGELTLEDGACQPAGVPEDGCAEGFQHVDDGCEPILPAAPCAWGEMAAPGETSCHEVMPCGSGTWGDIPRDATTQHVDASYTGGASDGSADDPWTTIQDGLDAASTGDVVAVAAGHYPENVVVTRKVQLWGRCPAMVEVDGQAAQYGAVTLMPGSGGSVVRGLALTGAGAGISITGAKDLLIDRVWAHDTALYGVVGQADLGRPMFTVQGSLFEATRVAGVAALGGDMVVEHSVVRDPEPSISPQSGFFAQPHKGERPSLVVRTSAVQHALESGVLVTGADATIEGLYLEGTVPLDPDGVSLGIQVRESPLDDDPSKATIRGSVLAANHSVALRVLNSEALVERTVVRDTVEGVFAGEPVGRGIDVAVFGERYSAALTVRESVVRNNAQVGVGAFGSDVTLESVVVRDNQPLSSGLFGRGILIQMIAELGIPGSGTVRGCVVERNHASGISVAGAQVTVSDTAVRDTQPEPATNAFGRGVSVGPGVDGLPSTITMTHVEVARSYEIGILILQSEATIEDAVVVDTFARTGDGAFGDGVAVSAEGASTSLTMRRSSVTKSARAGVSNFGAHVSLGDSEIACNAIDLDGENLEGTFSFDDLGHNTCGCGDGPKTCKAVSSTLEPPTEP